MAKPNPAAIYDTVLVPAMFIPSTAALLALARPRTGERLLDIACGTGIVARTAASIVGDANVTGLDIAPPMLAVARSKSPGIAWKQVALDVPDRAFDLVTCQHGIQFFPDRPAAAREMRRVLRDTGRAAICAWQGLDRHPFIATMLGTVARTLGQPVAPLALPFSLTADDLRGLLAQAGFRSVEVVERKLRARFPSADRYVRLSTYGARAVFPQLACVDLEPVVAAVQRDTADLIARHREGDRLAFDLYMNVAIARA